MDPFNKYHGDSKYLTKDCPECSFYLERNNHEICDWGVAVKELISTEKPRTCHLKSKESPRKQRLTDFLEEHPDYYNPNLSFLF